MNVLGIVPARGGSKRVPRKNIRLLGGIPLISHCLRAARDASSIHRLVVSTDDDEIAGVARNEGVEVLMRPAELAQDGTPTLPVIEHVLSTLDDDHFRADIILTIQPPYPFLTAEHIEQAVAALRSDETLDSATTVTRRRFTTTHTTHGLPALMEQSVSCFLKKRRSVRTVNLLRRSIFLAIYMQPAGQRLRHMAICTVSGHFRLSLMQLRHLISMTYSTLNWRNGCIRKGRVSRQHERFEEYRQYRNKKCGKRSAGLYYGRSWGEPLRQR